MAIALLAACGGGGGQPLKLRPIETGQGAAPPAAPTDTQPINDYLDEQKASLPSWPSATTGAIKGTLAVESYTLLNPIALVPVSYAEGIVQVPLRVVDPEDDVDCIAFPQPSGSFVIPNLPALSSATLTVTVPVAEDINGDRKKNDAVVVSLPVSVITAKQTLVNITISPLPADTLQEDALPGGLLQVPPVQVEYYYSGPDGARQRTMALFIGLQRMLVDTNGDGEFGADDLQFADENNNGLSDTTEGAGFAGPLAPMEETAEGIILSLQGRFITLRNEFAGASIELEVTETTVIIDQLGSPIALSQHIVGRYAMVQFQRLTGGGRLAQLVMVDLSPPMGMEGPRGPG
jgi:hypothetical protein